jgi:hypothetical protein
MKIGTGPGFRPKTTVSGRGVGWQPALAAGCHGVVAHRAARTRARQGAVNMAEAGAVARAATAHRRLAWHGVEGEGTKAVGGVRRARREMVRLTDEVRRQ